MCVICVLLVDGVKCLCINIYLYCILCERIILLSG